MPKEGTKDEAAALRDGVVDVAEEDTNGGGVGTGVGKAVGGAEIGAKPGKAGFVEAEKEGADSAGCGRC